MPEINLPQPPRKDESRFDDWLFRFYKKVLELGTSTDTTTSHTSISNLNTSSYSHLTGTQKSDLTDGGDSSAHYHSADRSRANHSGTQSSNTISDFTPAVLALVGSGSDVLQSQVFGA